MSGEHFDDERAQIEKKSSAPNAGKAWTYEMDQALFNLAANGVPVEEAAKRCGRTVGAIVGRLAAIIDERLRWKTLCDQASAFAAKEKP